MRPKQVPGKYKKTPKKKVNFGNRKSWAGLRSIFDNDKQKKDNSDYLRMFDTLR
jgi:hypothetical protein